MSTKKLMAEFIYDSPADFCQVCTNNEQCAEKAKSQESKGEEFLLPPKAFCVNGIICYFEKQSFMERKQNDNK